MHTYFGLIGQFGKRVEKSYSKVWRRKPWISLSLIIIN